MNPSSHVLILGAAGSAGSAIASALGKTGARVTLAGRSPRPPHLQHLKQLPWQRLDVLDTPRLRELARDCDVIVHAVSPASYTDWHRTVAPMLESVLAAVASPDVTVVLPGNVYGLQPGPAAQTEDMAAAATPICEKGRQRQALELRLLQAAHAGQCRSLVLRAGDFFGPHAPGTWFRRVLLAGGPHQGRVSRLIQPGTPGVGHLWTYLPDFAQTLADLLARRAALPRHAVFHTAGHWDSDGQTLLRHLADALAQSDGRRPAIRAFPWWALRLASPVHAMSRELLSMRWLWQQALRLDNHKLRHFLQAPEPHTPWAEAVQASLAA